MGRADSSYGVQGFSRVAQVVLPSPWGSQLAWSDWSTEKKTTSMSMASARLAVALTDGSVWVIPVTRSTDGATWDTTVGEAARAGPADRRGVTALEWMTVGHASKSLTTGRPVSMGKGWLSPPLLFHHRHPQDCPARQGWQLGRLQCLGRVYWPAPLLADDTGGRAGFSNIPRRD